MYVPDAESRGIVTLYSVRNCIDYGVMDELARRERWMNEQAIFEVLRQHFGGIRFDVSLHLHERLNCCIPKYREGALE